jgi:HTH-type transcriptional repressor of puuD
MDISKRLTELREQHGLSKNKLSKLSGVSQSVISYIESGQRQPTLDVLERLSKALGMSLIQFLDDSPEQLPPDLLQLLETAKKLTPEERRAVTDMIKTLKR